MLAQATQPATTLPISPIVATSKRLLDRLGLGETWHETDWYEWIWLLGGIFVGVVAGRLVASSLRTVGANFEKRGHRAFATVICSGAAPANLFLTTLGLGTGLKFIHIADGPLVVVSKVLTLLYVIAIGWFLFNIIELIDLWLETIASHTKSHLDDQLAPLIRKTLRIFLVVLVGLYIAQNIFDQNITTWLAGLGIAGLAVSLAAQDSIKNLFGSMTILLDKPFTVGDRIFFDNNDGEVEEIGFRSTKVRTLAGDLVSIPNAKFIDNSIRNISRRQSIPKSIEFPLPADTTSERLHSILDRLRGVLREPGLDGKYVGEPKVYFDEVRAGAPILHVNYSFDPADQVQFNEHVQALQLRLWTVLKEELQRPA